MCLPGTLAFIIQSRCRAENLRGKLSSVYFTLDDDDEEHHTDDKDDDDRAHVSIMI